MGRLTPTAFECAHASWDNASSVVSCGDQGGRRGTGERGTWRETCKDRTRMQRFRSALIADSKRPRRALARSLIGPGDKSVEGD